MNSMLWEFDEDSPKLIYPGDHKVGMRVPHGARATLGELTMDLVSEKGTVQ